MSRSWLDKPIYVVEDIHADGSRTAHWPRPGWWLMALLARDALCGRREAGSHCTHCGEPLHRDGYCSLWPDKGEEVTSSGDLR
jgi:hypothetical protein